MANPWEMDWSGSVPDPNQQVGITPPEGPKPWEMDWGTPTQQPPLEGAGQMPGGSGKVMDFFYAFNDTLAEAIGSVADFGIGGMDYKPLSVAALDATYEKLGKEPQDAAQVLKEAMNSIGMGTAGAEVDNFASRLGRNTFQNLMMFGGFLKAAPYMAAIKPTGNSAQRIAQLVAQKTGQATQAAPFRTAATAELAASVGQTVGEETGIPGADVVGGMAGGIGAGLVPSLKTVTKVGVGALSSLPGVVTSMVEPTTGIGLGLIGAKMGGVRGGRLYDWASRQFTKTPRNPLVDGTSPVEATEFAKAATEADKLAVTEYVDGALNMIGGQSMSSAQRARSLEAVANAAYERAQKKASDHWSKVDMKAPAGAAAQEIIAATKQIDANIDPFNPSARPKPAREGKEGPMELIYKLIPEDAPGPDTTGVDVQINVEPTLGNLRAIQTEISTRMRENVSPPEMRNLTLLSQAIDNAITAQFPNSKHIKAATDYSRWLHDTFTRGPLGQLRGAEMSASREAAQSVTERAEAALRDDRIGEIIGAASRKLKMPQIAGEAEQLIRAQIAEDAMLASERAAVGIPEHEVSAVQAKAVKKYFEQPHIKSILNTTNPDGTLVWGKAAQEFAEAGGEMRQALEITTQLRKGQFYKLAETDVDTAVANLMSDPKKAINVSAIRSRLENSPPALRGFQNAWLLSLMNAAKGSPTALDNILKQRDIDKATSILLDPDMYKRLQYNVKVGSAIENNWAHRTTGWLGGKLDTILGRSIGATISQKLPGNTVQRGGQFATAANALSTWLVGATDVSSLFTQAIMDPKMEKVLWSKAPLSINEIKAHTALIRTVAGSIAAGNALMEDEK